MVESQTMAEFTNAVIEETAALNPHLSTHLTSLQLKERITMDPKDPTKITDVDFSYLGIKALPEFFGYLKIIGNLSLHGNALTSLPESMGSMKVGGYLFLSHNELTSLPESMGSIQVGGSLHLYNNNLPDPKPTKADFPNVKGDVQAGSHTKARIRTLTYQQLL